MAHEFDDELPPMDAYDDGDGGNRSGGRRSSSGGSGPTEDAVARGFEADERGSWKFSATRARWHHWDGHIWKPDEKSAVLDAIRAHIRETAPKKFHKRTAVAAIEALCRAARVFARVHSDFDQNPYPLGTPGGTVDLRSGKLRPAIPDDLITRCTSAAPVAGIPQRFAAFLQEACGGDTAMVRFIQQVLGYALTGDTSAHAVFFVYGDGGTGKSTLLNVVQHVLGTYARSAPMETFAAASFDRHPTEIAMLAGARLVSANETEQGRRWAAARIKELSGGDKVRRGSWQDLFEVVPEFKFLFVGNFAPSFETVDEAMRLRFYVVPFDVKPKKKDGRLAEALALEAARYCLMIDGCIDRQANGFTIPAEVQEATDHHSGHRTRSHIGSINTSIAAN